VSILALFTKKVMLQQQTFRRAYPTSWRKKTAGLDMMWRNYVTLTLKGKRLATSNFVTQ